MHEMWIYNIQQWVKGAGLSLAESLQLNAVAEKWVAEKASQGNTFTNHDDYDSLSK